MALTYGFYSSLNGDRKYNAEQMSTIFNGIIRDGVFKEVDQALAVKAQSTPSLTLNISKGRAWFNGTWTRNDAVYPITLSTADPIHPRYDAICLRVDKRPASRANSFIIKTGTPAASPAPPVIDSGIEYVYDHALAFIRVNANQTAITQSYITTAIGLETVTVNGTSRAASPYVKALLEKYELDNMVSQWQSQFYEWMTQNDNEYDAWAEDKEDTFTAWMGDFTSTNTSEFNEWFETLQTALEPDVATSLGNMIALLKGVHSAIFKADNWTKSGNIYSQTADCLGMEEGYSPILVKSLPHGSTVTEAKAYNKNYGILSNGTGETGHNTVTFNVYSKPDADITVGFKGI